jgi:hypothetical protein
LNTFYNIYICPIWWTGDLTNDWHSNGYELCFLLADLFLHAYESDFLQGHLKNKDRKLAKTFNSGFRYIDDVLSLNNSRFGDYLHRIYPNELEVKDTTDIQKSASYLDIHLEMDNGGRTIKNKLYTNFCLIKTDKTTKTVFS